MDQLSYCTFYWPAVHKFDVISPGQIVQEQMHVRAKIPGSETKCEEVDSFLFDLMSIPRCKDLLPQFVWVNTCIFYRFFDIHISIVVIFFCKTNSLSESPIYIPSISTVASFVRHSIVSLFSKLQPVSMSSKGSFSLCFKGAGITFFSMRENH